MSARSKARKRALDILFESELQGLPVGATLGDRIAEAEQPLNAYVLELVHGVADHQPRIDELVETHATGWTLERMPAVDRNALRIGVYELLYGEEVPEAVAITEAMNLVRDLSTDDSPTFVNGVLGAILRDKPALLLEAASVDETPDGDEDGAGDQDHVEGRGSDLATPDVSGEGEDLQDH
jgi:N utilization substance protein B